MTDEETNEHSIKAAPIRQETTEGFREAKQIPEANPGPKISFAMAPAVGLTLFGFFPFGSSPPQVGFDGLLVVHALHFKAE